MFMMNSKEMKNVPIDRRSGRALFTLKQIFMVSLSDMHQLEDDVYLHVTT